MAAHRPSRPSSLLRVLPADLVAVCVVTILVNIAVFAPVVRETAARIPLVIAFLLFVPGYAVIAALYPKRGESPTVSEANQECCGTARNRSGIDGVERVALSLALSAVVVPVIGFLLNFTQWGIRPLPVALSISAFTVVLVGAAAVRRWNVPEAERFRVPYATWFAAGLAAVLQPNDRADAALTFLFVASVVLAAGSVGYAAANLPQEDEFSSVELLMEDNESIADEYPTKYDGSKELILEIKNQEGETVNYTVVLAEQRVESGDDENVVHEQRELDRLEIQIADNETWTTVYHLEPTMADDVQLVWLVYLDDVPDGPSTENADYHVHIWVETGDDETAVDD
jgi:uncharacterized membrane protein